MNKQPYNKTLTAKTGKDILNLLGAKDLQSRKLNVLPPVGDTQNALYNIWKSLLGQESFSANEDFFQIGGNSLKAVQLASRIANQFSVDIELTDIFLHPTISTLAAFIEGHQKKSHISSIEIQPRPENIPLSFSQERLWFIHQLVGSIQYILPIVLRLKGALNKQALANALETIVDRHEVLRTIFLEKDGIPYQQIKNKKQWQLSITSDSRLKDENALQQYIQHLIQQPFDLSKDDMLRANLIELNNQEYVLIATLHHIAADGWSMAVFVKEIVELYTAYTQNRQPQLNELPIQYTDYSIWQRNFLQGEELEKKLSYWKNKLKSSSPLDLPTDYPRSAKQSTNGAIISFNIENDLFEAIHQFSLQQGTTLFMTLLAAYKVLLHRYSNQNDICVGTPIANRNQQELEGLVGFFVNTIVLRSEVHAEAPFTELLQQVKQTTLEAYEYSETPFEKVVEAVVKERDMSRSPLFQVMFALQNTPEVPRLSLGEAKLSFGSAEHTTTLFELFLNIRETPRGLQGFLQYATDLYKEQTIRRMLAHFEQLLHNIVHTPEQPIGRLSLL
ncbi:MAG: non-ribosomal peptide synthetase, partial [Flavisolibacter sp.]|nr:non-ribosomal peptide synthetase [Flavisolibacter sp.]